MYLPSASLFITLRVKGPTARLTLRFTRLIGFSHHFAAKPCSIPRRQVGRRICQGSSAGVYFRAAHAGPCYRAEYG